jgi:hypothetical protein
MRRALPVLGFVLLVVCLSSLHIIPWQWSLGVVTAASAGYLWLRWRRQQPPTLPRSQYKQPLSLPVGDPPEPPATQITVVESTSQGDPDEPENPTEQYLDVGPSPAPIPTSVAETHAALYDHHFRVYWFIERIIGGWLLFILLCVSVAVTAANNWVALVNDKTLNTAWSHIGDALFVLALLLALQTAYYWVKWNVTRFVVTKDAYAMPSAMPGPFTFKTPMIRTFEATYDIKQNWLDRRLKTCRLAYDDKKESKIDDIFRSVKWLPYPDELREACGSPPIRKPTFREQRKQRRQSTS